jgi:calcineurin-like phosphoesterase family protein
MTTWLTTDWHLHHKNIMKYENRPNNFESIILDNINSTIKDGDRLINLGDVAFGLNIHDTIFNFISNIKHHHDVSVYLLKGNHDKKSNNFYLSCLFDYVDHDLIINHTLLSHCPRDLNLSQFKNVKYNIHGHMHRALNRDDELSYPFYDNEKHILLSIERTNYQLINLDEFEKSIKIIDNKKYLYGSEFVGK